MGRHANGTKNYRIAGWIWFALIALVLVVALIIGWGALRQSNEASTDQKQCPEGDYSLNVWAAPERGEAAQQLVDKYNESGQVVNDHCVKAEVSQVADQEVLDKAKSSDGVSSVWIPASPSTVAKGMADAGINTNGKDVPVVDGAAVFALGNDRGIDEQAARSGNDFASFAADSEGAQVVPLDQVADGSFDVDATSNDTTETQSSAGNQSEAEKPADDNAADADGATTSGPAAVTFVVDTSGSMGLYEGDYTRMDNIRGPISDAMRGIGERGGIVSLWNYSSPINPGVSVPYRDNVDISVGDDGTMASGIVNQLGFGGATYTHESVLAAYRAAVANASGSDKPGRLVLITDGPNDGGSIGLESAVAAIEKLHGEQAVLLEVVTIGENVDTEAMQQIAQAGGGNVHHAADSLGITEPLREAVEG
ncbi:vWA domain-containing protein [Corynebacterium dentalis]|uniref:vWA domain-containing protein n=1 Tax=Corynebacterium dentalis TaxID=2014528 RepID=UPI000C06D96C|nr:VWA domain-containing protein [Corynebacterium dentalis]